MPVTTSQVDRAGRTLRTWWTDPFNLMSPGKVDAAYDILTEYRAAHGPPLIKANNGLRSMLRTEGCQVHVSQRLKRMATIVGKLVREPTMALSRMQDIGGCRAILEDVEELRRVEKRLGRRRPALRVDDYVAKPRDSGYRAVHVIVQYDARCIEIQLRTRLMHDWAVAVERLGGRMNEDLKSGEGPGEVLVWLEAVSEAMAVEEAGEIVDTTLMDRIRALRQAALPHIPELSR